MDKGGGGGGGEDAGDGGAGGDEEGEGEGEEEALDPYEMMDPVEIISKIPKNFFEQVKFCFRGTITDPRQTNCRHDKKTS